MSEKKQDKKPEDLSSDDLDAAVGGAIMHDDRVVVHEKDARKQEQSEK